MFHDQLKKTKEYGNNRVAILLNRKEKRQGNQFCSQVSFPSDIEPIDPTNISKLRLL